MIIEISYGAPKPNWLAQDQLPPYARSGNGPEIRYRWEFPWPNAEALGGKPAPPVGLWRELPDVYGAINLYQVTEVQVVGSRDGIVVLEAKW